MKTVYHPKTGKAITCENHQFDLMVKAGYKAEASEVKAEAETKAEAKPAKVGK
ncbi:hypothetical protein [Zhongshania sp.]|uniref:hypothetical protein n=1 Tax=Zhongshania sp. TaxID=1971902 RepID=UPI00356AC310